MNDQKLAITDKSDTGCGIPAHSVICPCPSSKSTAEKLGIFAVGVVTGAIALGVTAAIVENLDKITSTIGNDTESENEKRNQILDMIPINKN